MSNNSPLIDTGGSRHTLQIAHDETGLLVLDQHPVLSIHQTAELVIFTTDNGQEIPCSPEACWYAVAGVRAEPTASEAERLLAAHLAHRTEGRRLRALIQSLSGFIEEQAAALVLPQPRLDLFIEAALSRLEEQPTFTKVAALSQVIDQPPALIVAWLKQRGKMVLPLDDPPQADGSEDSPASGTELGTRATTPTKAARVMFRWTGEMIEQLRAEFLAAPPHQSISAAAKTIAERHQWPMARVEYKIYHLDLPHAREARQSPSPLPPLSSEQDEPAGEVTGAVFAPERDSPAPAVEVSPPPQTSPDALIELCRGNFVWDVRVDGAIQRWLLDYPYGSFPVQQGLVEYQGITYELQMVGINTVRATSIARPAYEETTLVAVNAG